MTRHIDQQQRVTVGVGVGGVADRAVVLGVGRVETAGTGAVSAGVHVDVAGAGVGALALIADRSGERGRQCGAPRVVARGARQRGAVRRELADDVAVQVG